MPPRAAHLDPRDASTMRCALARGASGCTPLGLAPPAYSRLQVQPLPWRRPRDASAAAHSTPLSRANPSDRPPSLTARERFALAARQSPPGSSPSAEGARERAGGLVSTLTPRRAVRRRVGVLLLHTLVRNQSDRRPPPPSSISTHTCLSSPPRSSPSRRRPKKAGRAPRAWVGHSPPTSRPTPRRAFGGGPRPSCGAWITSRRSGAAGASVPSCSPTGRSSTCATPTRLSTRARMPA